MLASREIKEAPSSLALQSTFCQLVGRYTHTIISHRRILWKKIARDSFIRPPFPSISFWQKTQLTFVLQPLPSVFFSDANLDDFLRQHYVTPYILLMTNPKPLTLVLFFAYWLEITYHTHKQ